jgi:NADPH2:quinone reductase
VKIKAVIMTKPGGSEVLKLVEMDAPGARKPHAVLIRVRAAGINPADCQPLASRHAYMKEWREPGNSNLPLA